LSQHKRQKNLWRHGKSRYDGLLTAKKKILQKTELMHCRKNEFNVTLSKRKIDAD
jgi:hypothetical protein